MLRGGQGMMVVIESIKMRHIQLLLFCCMIVGYYYFSYIDLIGHFSLGVVSLVVLFSIISLNYCMRSNRTLSNPHTTISVVLILLALFLYVVNGVDLIRLVKTIGIPIMIIFAVKEVVKSEQQAKRALVLIATVVSISCIVAILQAMDIDFFWDLRMMIDKTNLHHVARQFAQRSRPPGLAMYGAPLAYQICSIFPFVIYLACISRTRKRIILLGICLVLGALVSQSLAAILSILVSYIIFMRLNHLLSLRKLFGFIIILIFLVIVVSYFNDLASSRIIQPDQSTLRRIPLTIMGVYILSNVPFGINTGADMLNMIRHYSTEYSYLSGAKSADITEFLNLGITHGWAILLVYIWLYLYIFRFAYKAMKSSTIGSVDYYFYSGAIAFFCAYIVQSFTHNSGLTTSDPYDWIMIGIILAYKPSQVNSDEYRKVDEKI